MFTLRAAMTSNLMDGGTGCRECLELTDEAPGRGEKFRNAEIHKFCSSYILLG